MQPVNRSNLLSRFPLLLPLALASALFCAELAWSRESPRVLPQGIYRARLVGAATSNVKDTINEDGKLQSLSYSLNRTVTISDLAANASPETRVQLNTLISSLNTLQPGLGDQLAGSQLQSKFEMQQQLSLVAMEYGLTPRLSLGIRAPVVRRIAKNNFRANAVNNAAAINNSLGNISASATAGLSGVSSQQLDTAFFENALFTSKGYQSPRDFEKTQLGDVEFGGKYNVFKNDYLYSSFLIGFAAPTGAPASMENPFDKGISREAWSYAIQGLQEVYPVKDISIGAAAKLSYSLRDSRQRAVPRNANDTLPSLLPKDGQVENVARQRGLQLETEISAGYKFFGDVLGIWSAYQYSSKSKDKFFGTGNLYYEGLAKNTDWKMHAMEFGGEFSTIPAFRRKKFPVPMDISLLYNQTLRGKNTPMVSYTRLDLMVYF